MFYIYILHEVSKNQFILLFNELEFWKFDIE